MKDECETHIIMPHKITYNRWKFSDAFKTHQTDIINNENRIIFL